MGEKISPATDSELSILRSLWSDGEGTVRELDARLRAEGRTWAYTTLQTLLARLESKNLVRVNRNGFAHVFSPAVSREQFLSQRLSSLAQDVCDGTATPLVLALVEGAKFSSNDIAEFRRLLDDLDKKRTGAPTKRKKNKS